ncbi:dUTP diphosphatase [Yaniella flava]|uniref:Deoxyuridine 5'-triphosphate nucleotidohydrolase n=1 Tax=Yaniella flava TaxID=287930 RepID=A0ABN2UG11_9MICC
MSDGQSTDEQSPHQLTIEVTMLDAELNAPEYALPGDAGADLVTTIDVTLHPGQRQLVPSGVAMAIPNGFAAFVHPRSGLAVRAGLSVVNAPGTIDAGYRGEIKVPLINLDPTETIQLRRGERIAQLVIQPVYQANFVDVDELPETARNDGGFGSTGGFSTRQ